MWREGTQPLDKLLQRKLPVVDDETCMQLQTCKTRFSCNRDMIFLPKSNNLLKNAIASTSSIKRVNFVEKIKHLVQRDVQTWRMGRPKVLKTTGAAPRLSFGWWYLHVDPYLHVPVLRKYCNTYFKQDHKLLVLNSVWKSLWKRLMICPKYGFSLFP